MIINFFKWEVTFSVSVKEKNFMEKYVFPITWYFENYQENDKGINWKKYLGTDKISAIKALRNYYWVTYKKFPDLKSSKEFIENYAFEKNINWW